MFDAVEKKRIKAAFVAFHLALDAALPGEEDLQEIEISPQTERRIERLIRRQKHFYYNWINTVAKRVACIVAAILLAAALLTAGVEGLREAFVNFVVEVFEKGSTIFFFQKEANRAEVTPVVPKIPSYLLESIIFKKTCHKTPSSNDLLYERVYMITQIIISKTWLFQTE